MIVWVRLVNSALISFERFPWKLSPAEAVLCHRCHSDSCQPLVFLRHSAGQDDGRRGQTVLGEEAVPYTFNTAFDCINMLMITRNQTRKTRNVSEPRLRLLSTQLHWILEHAINQILLHIRLAG